MEPITMPEVPDRYEQAARMKFIEGKTWAEVERSMGIPKTSMDRLRKRIRRDMETAINIMLLMRKQRPLR